MNKSIKLIFNYLLAPLLFLVLSWSLYRQIISQPDLEERWQQIKLSWQQAGFWLVFLLMFINWGIEARKWQLLISPLEKFSFFRAYKSVLAGCSVTMLTPNRIGEYGGRIIYVKEENRLKAISVTILGSLSQLLVTLFMGSIGLYFIKIVPGGIHRVSELSWLFGNILWIFSVGLTVIFILIYLRIRWVISAMNRFSFLHRLTRYIGVLDVFSGKQLLRILILSFCRYMVFILQFVLLLNVMHIEVSMEVSFWLLTIFYLVMTIAPTVGFIELPVRAAASVELFKIFSGNIIGIQAATLGIWLINLVIPAILGSVLIFGIKIMKEK